MSQRKEKYLRRALSQYDAIVEDVDRSRTQSEQALNMVRGQEERNIEERISMERRFRGALRRESQRRRSDGRVAQWALGLALVDLAVMIALAVVLL